MMIAHKSYQGTMYAYKHDVTRAPPWNFTTAVVCVGLPGNEGTCGCLVERVFSCANKTVEKKHCLEPYTV